MTVNKISLLCKVIALLMLLTVVFHWNVFLIFFNYPLPIGWYVIMVLMALIFVIINIISAVGLFWGKKWGFTTSYLAIVFSSLFFGTCYIPYFPHLFPREDRAYVLTLVNLIIIVIIASLQYLSRPNKSIIA